MDNKIYSLKEEDLNKDDKNTLIQIIKELNNQLDIAKKDLQEANDNILWWTTSYKNIVNNNTMYKNMVEQNYQIAETYKKIINSAIAKCGDAKEQNVKDILSILQEAK